MGTKYFFKSKSCRTYQKNNYCSTKNGCKIIYTKTIFSDDFYNTINPNSPVWYKSKTLKTYQDYPELREKLTVHRTWGVGIIDEIKPKKRDIVVEKLKYSGFFKTNSMQYSKTAI